MKEPQSNPLADLDADRLAAALESVDDSDEYTKGVRDLLRLLNLAPDGEVTSLVIASLRAHLADGVTIGFDWNDLDNPSLRGVDILAAFEARRVQAVENPTPARVVTVTQAVIKTRRADGDRYLLQYDRHAGRYQPIGGKKDPPDRDSAAALRRELMEELALDAIPGPEVCRLEMIASGQQEVSLSATYGVLSSYTFDLYNVQAIRFPIAVDGDTGWFTLDEIAAHRAADGRPISDIYERLAGLDTLASLPPSA